VSALRRDRPDDVMRRGLGVRVLVVAVATVAVVAAAESPAETGLSI
jgi:hypothetical protein